MHARACKEINETDAVWGRPEEQWQFCEIEGYQDTQAQRPGPSPFLVSWCRCGRARLPRIATDAAGGRTALAPRYRT